jgi:hypothetical protein
MRPFLSLKRDLAMFIKSISQLIKRINQKTHEKIDKIPKIENIMPVPMNPV